MNPEPTLSDLDGDVFGKRPDPINLTRMKEIYAVWNAARGDRSMPLRSDISPVALKGWLPHIAMIKRISAEDWLWTLEGTELVRHTETDFTNSHLSDIAGVRGRRRMIEEVKLCAQSGRPSWYFNTPSIFRTYTKVDKLRLPLGDGSGVTHMMMAIFRNPPLPD